MMIRLSFEELSATEFEELTYDLLIDLGFEDISWRKGTDLGASPADSGRDIECFLTRPDVDGSPIRERWFVECKHQKKGVPPRDLDPLLAWAQAENPQCALFVVSGFLSNPSKDYLARYEDERKPNFRIKHWERPKLERLLAGQTSILAKYELGTTTSQMDLIHPIHVLYMRDQLVGDLDALFSLLERFPEKDLNDILGFVPIWIVNPAIRKPVTGQEPLGALFDRDVSYSAFKHKCRTLATTVAEGFLVRAVVSDILAYLLEYGDTTRIEEKIEKNRETLVFAEARKREDPDNGELYDHIIDGAKLHIDEMPAQTERYRSLYNQFCDEVVRQLYVQESSLISKWLADTA